MSSQYSLPQPFMRGISRIKGFLTELPHPTCPSHPQTYLYASSIHHLRTIFCTWERGVLGYLVFHTSFDLWTKQFTLQRLQTLHGKIIGLHVKLSTALQKHYLLEVQGPYGPRLLVGGPSGLLTLSFAPFRRSGHLAHAKLTNTYLSILKSMIM